MKNRFLPTILTLTAGALWPMLAFSGPQDSISSDGLFQPIEPYSSTEFSAQSWLGQLLQNDSPAFAGADEVTDEALITDGAVIDEGTGDQFSDEELATLSALPVPSGAVETESGAEADGAEIVLGFDSRQRLYTTYYPARAQVLITFSGGRCSGTMIGKDTASTAGHCVHTGGSGGSWRSGVTVYPGANGSYHPYGYCTAKRLYSVIGWTENANEEYDYGAVKLNCTVGNTVGWYGITTAYPYNLPSIIQGYPGDKPLTQWLSADKVRAISTRQVFYSNDTTGGMSGSAVWTDRSGPRIIGIHAYRTHGTGDHALYNHGTRITSEVFNNLVTWKYAL